MAESLDLTTLNKMDPERCADALRNIFEHSPWIAKRACAGRPFVSVKDLHDVMVSVVKQATRDAQLALMRAHPELAGRQAQADELTDASRAEQSGAGLNALTKDEMANITRLNAAYHERFGFPFIIAVRKHTKHSIMAEFERRLANDVETELATGLEQVFLIARLRLDALLQP